MIDPLSPLFHSHGHGLTAGSIMPTAADPAASFGLMVVGLIIIIATAAWSLGGLGAAVWTRIDDANERRHQALARRGPRPIRR